MLPGQEEDLRRDPDDDESRLLEAQMAEFSKPRGIVESREEWVAANGIPF